jgi:hypothetical protein
VLQLFEDVVDAHRMPSHMRGDHGVENVEVARNMEAERGIEWGSFIWGRYVAQFFHSFEGVLTFIIGAFTTDVLRDYGMMSQTHLVENGRTFLWILRRIMV